MTKAGNFRISIANNLAGLREGLQALGAWLESHGAATTASDNANLVFEEIVNNISRYGFDDGGEHSIEVTGRIDDKEMTLTFDDAGRPFDPRTQPSAKPAESLEEATIGGRGILLVRAAARRLDYERTPQGHNRFSVTLAR